MRWSEIEILMKSGFEVAVEIGGVGERNKYFIRKEKQLYYPISSFQFDKLLEGGYIDCDYHIEHNNGLWGMDQMIYKGR